MAIADTSETSQAEGEGPDGSDKPPHETRKSQTTPSSQPKAKSTPQSPPNKIAIATGTPLMQYDSTSVPLPSPEAGAYPKEPGHTRLALEKLSIGGLGGKPNDKQSALHDSPSPSESGTFSLPSTRPPSQAPSRANSRAPSFSAGFSGGKVATPAKKGTEPPASRPRAPSVNSTDGSHKFNLKDLLSGGPKLSRRSSVKSNGSSKKSDSDNGDAKSNAGSQTSLSKKYGVCQKVAIGKGATSVVRLAHKWDRTEEKLYAVKEFRKRRKNESEKEYVKKLTAEFCISSTLHHINIVETVDLVQDEEKRWCEVMEFCPGGDLYAAIKKGGMSPSEVECCFKQILTGVSYLHSQGVAHRDLKPENLFFDTKGHLKIGDYGASTVYRLPWEATIHMSTGLCGSEPYIAPEQFLGKPYDARLVDIWACGIVYYCLHFQELPWRVAQVSDQLYGSYAAACAAAAPATAATTTFPPTINNLNPRGCRSLIRKMLEPDPKLRWPIEEVVKHSWMQGIEVCHLVDKPSHVHVHARSLAEQQAPVYD